MVILTKTTISDFLACEQKYYLGQVIGYQQKNRPKTMVIGSMLHMAKELLALGLTPPKIKLEIQKEMAVIFKGGMFSAEACKEIEAIAFHGALYCPWPVLDGAEFEKLILMPMYEVLHGVRFGVSEEFMFGGKIDEAIPLRDSVQLVDYKTKDSIGNVGLSWFEKVLSLDLQQILYRTAYSKAHDVTVSKFEFRYIKRPGIRQKKNETHDQYVTRIASEYSDPANADKYYTDCTAPGHNAHNVLENLQRVLARLANRYEKGGWEQNPLSCISYNNACRYLPICYNEPGWKDLFEDVGPDYHPELERKDEKPERTKEGGEQEF